MSHTCNTQLIVEFWRILLVEIIKNNVNFSCIYCNLNYDTVDLCCNQYCESNKQQLGA